MSKRNVLVMQSGGSTPVFNRSLAGVVLEASERPGLGAIYGAAHGLEGLLRRDLLDLRRPSKASWARIARAPGAALGSTRRRLRDDDVPRVTGVLRELQVRYYFIIGGNDSAETGHRLSIEAGRIGYELGVVHVPKTIDNDLVLTDHSPGYGSAGRFVALAAMGAGRDAEGMGPAAPITVIEVMGRDAGWLAASAALARREERDAPHAVCVPEVPVEEDGFVGRVDDAYRRFGFAVAVVAENARGPDGVLGGHAEPWYVDEFGHPYYEGSGRYLAKLLGQRLKVRVRYEKPGTIQRSMAACVSRTDAVEAELVGRAAVGYALEGHSDRMVGLLREPGDSYRCTTVTVPLAEVAGRVKAMPAEYLDPAAYFVTGPFIEYARALIGAPLPRWGRLR